MSNKTCLSHNRRYDKICILRSAERNERAVKDKGEGLKMNRKERIWKSLFEKVFFSECIAEYFH